MYYLYHIPGKKIGVTTNLEDRVERQQGYNPGEYEVIEQSEDINFISEGERVLQKFYGYRIDDVLYSELKFNKNNNNMNINVTEQTTTFPCPVNKLKGQLMDNIGLGWDTEFGTCRITIPAIEWIMLNVKESMYNNNRCYVYNKAFARYFDNNDPYNGKTLAGALSPMDKQECCKEEDVSRECLNPSHFDLIRGWAQTRGLYDGGDPKTQALKLVEEVGETCRAILKQDTKEMIDGIGDCVVVLTNLAELIGTPIEDCIDKAYNEIKGRTGKMNNGTFKKDD